MNLFNYTFKKNFFLLFLFFFFKKKSFTAVNYKYEPDYSYGLKIGLSKFFHPFNDDDFIEKYPNCTKKDTLSFNSAIFFEKRFFNQIFGIGGELEYRNRNFFHLNELYFYKYYVNLRCLDFSILFSILPKGYGGFSFYLGPKFYFIFSKSSSYTKSYMNENKKVENLGEIFSSINIGAVIGCKFEIDRLGIIFGFDYDHFFMKMNKISNSKKENCIAQGIRFYVGYDFARLKSDYFNN